MGVKFSFIRTYSYYLDELSMGKRNELNVCNIQNISNKHWIQSHLFPIF